MSERPARCVGCKEDCYACDHTLERWPFTPLQELHLRRTLKVKAINRLRREVREIDTQINALLGAAHQ